MKVNITSHRFEKKNMHTIKGGGRGGYDLYVCADCGCKGKRYELDGAIEISDKSAPLCKKSSPKKVKIINEYTAGEFGFDMQKEYEPTNASSKQYKNDVWVFSDKRNEPVRLLTHKYVFV